MRYGPKPKKEATRARVAKMTAGWDFFPRNAHARITNSVASAIEAYYRLARPEPVDIRELKAANLAPPLRPQQGRPSNVPEDMLVGGLAQIYASIAQKLGTRSWDDANEHSDFERLVEEVFQIIGIEKSALAAVERHIKARNALPDEYDDQDDFR
jgi:hypothetical protein